MSRRRKSDTEVKQRFRSERFFQNDRRWYYETREGNVQGPFQTKSEAEYNLQKYFKMVDAAVLPNDKSGLRLEPLETMEKNSGRPSSPRGR